MLTVNTVLRIALPSSTCVSVGDCKLITLPETSFLTPSDGVDHLGKARTLFNLSNCVVFKHVLLLFFNCLLWTKRLSASYFWLSMSQELELMCDALVVHCVL